MILNDLLGNDVLDDAGRRLGRVADVRFVLEGSGTPSQARLLGIIVSPRSASSFLGYERSSLSQPVILDRLLRWLHRGSFLVRWDDIRRIDDHEVRLRAGFESLPSTLED